MVSECPFCRISQGNEPAFIVHSTEHVIGFLPLRMEAPGHTVVAPRDHVEDMYDAASPQLMTLIEEGVANSMSRGMSSNAAFGSTRARQ